MLPWTQTYNPETLDFELGTWIESDFGLSLLGKVCTTCGVGRRKGCGYQDRLGQKQWMCSQGENCISQPPLQLAEAHMTDVWPNEE